MCLVIVETGMCRSEDRGGRFVALPPSTVDPEPPEPPISLLRQGFTR